MMAWGKGCSSWDDSVDLANILKFDGEIPDNHLVTTTWHENESLSDVFWFCKYTASSQFYDLKTIVLHISKADRSNDFQRTFKNA